MGQLYLAAATLATVVGYQQSGISIERGDYMIGLALSAVGCVGLIATRLLLDGGAGR